MIDYNGPFLNRQTFEKDKLDAVLEVLVPGDTVQFNDVDPRELKDRAEHWRKKRGIQCMYLEGGGQVTYWGDDKKTQARINENNRKAHKEAKARATLIAKIARATADEGPGIRARGLSESLRKLEPGQEHDVDTRNYNNIQSVRVAASQLGKELGRRYTVTATVKVTRLPDDPGAQTTRATPTILTIPGIPVIPM